MHRLQFIRLWIFVIWTAFTWLSIYARPLFPVDETRYVSVAWDMWIRDDWLVPHLNGETYSHKPPLLFWLIMLSWKLFGVNDWSHRFISPLFSLACVFLSGNIAHLLWPKRKNTETLSILILFGTWLWLVYGTLTMFDTLLSFFVLLGIYSLLQLARSGSSLKPCLLLGVAIGGGILSKGPVVLLHLSPIALLAPWWLNALETRIWWPKWYGVIALGLLFGSCIALSWAVPAGVSGGEAYRNAIFFGQTGGRLVKSFAHPQPWWWYSQILPLLLLPWLLMKPFWTGIGRLTIRDFGIRFCTAWIVPTVLVFSWVSGKGIHYLLPLMPALALILARTASEEVANGLEWKRAHLPVVSVFGLLGIVLSLMPWLNDRYHWLNDLSLISPAWGFLLTAGSAIVGLRKAENAEGSVCYVGIASIIAILIVSTGFFKLRAPNFDTRPAARQISVLMSENRPMAYFTIKYHGQYHFTGRLTQAISVLTLPDELHAWAKAHEDGYVLVEYRDSDALPKSIFRFHYPVKNHYLGILPSKILLEHPELAGLLKP